MNIRIVSTQSVVSHIFWTLVLQGALGILIGILVLVYPEVVPFLIAALFIVFGGSTLFLAWRIRRFWNEIPDMFKW